ncbi:MAG: NAD(P)H-dependent glycerol-3-phosphate dehydrogenase, partial [Verrucomicrobiota bacterium]
MQNVGMNIAILGAGAWGTAMALHLDRLGHRVTLTPRRMEQALALASERENRDYLPGYRLPNSMQIGNEIAPVLMEAELVLLASPMAGLRGLCEAMARCGEASWQIRLVAALCKGLETETLKLPGAVMAEWLPAERIATLSGPSFADEVARGLPTAVTLASAGAPDAVLAEAQQALSGSSFRVYTSRDEVGVEIGGCLKNVYAIAAGVCDGLELGANAKAALLTRALHEMAAHIGELGGEPETLMGLGGFGDLVATCWGPLSRNRGFGERLGQGERPEAILADRQTVVEGVHSARAFHHLATERGFEMP